VTCKRIYTVSPFFHLCCFRSERSRFIDVSLFVTERAREIKSIKELVVEGIVGSTPKVLFVVMKKEYRT
jgi:hypothetical protein